jgi:DnaJ domain/CSL zinc finger
MAPYNPMKKHMDKLDEWGSDHMKKFNNQRDAGSGASFSDKLKIARGKDDRWERTKKPNETEEGETVVPNRSTRLPPAPTNTFAGARTTGVPPPPPPQRSGSGAPPPPPSRSTNSTATAVPPPTLPRRMNNEAGTSNPPPPYPSSAPAPPTRGLSQNNMATGSEHIEFSKFGPEDKEAFFDLLDEYFAQRLNVSTGKSSSATAARVNPIASADIVTTSPSAASQKAFRRDPPKPSGPGIKSTIGKTTSAPPAVPKTATSAWSYPKLTASNHPYSETCKALSCASFMVYRDSYPEWSGSMPWFSQPNPMPSSLKGRRDIAWSSSSMYRGQDHTLMGACLFEDLSCLWWRIQWKGNAPAATAQVDCAYREPPEAFDDEGRLQEASRGFGDWIAGFAEQSEANKRPVGDGECWTLAAEAIKYTNNTAQLTPDNRLVTSIGRTHGHLIYAAKAEKGKGQCGRWRGGDRIRNNWGGIRRGDIIEWKTARCSEAGAPKGSYMTLGAPEHTAVIISNSPVPDRLSQMKGKRSKTNKEDTHYSILGVKPTATQAEIRSAYLAGARKHHPDRHVGVVNQDDEHIQRLNEAHATLTDARLREAYDIQLQSGRANKSTRSNQSRISATVDLDSMETVDGSETLTFFHPCRCGNGFYVDENQLQQSSAPIVGCSGCSEQIKIVSDPSLVTKEAEVETEEEDVDVDDTQPELAPWEIGTITTIEQSAGQIPTRRTYNLAADSFTEGEIWIYRPVWEKEYLGGAVQPGWPPALPNWQSLT